jgi:ribosome-binding factor A
MTRRTDRIGELLLREIGSFVQTETRDPRIGFVTFSRIDVTTDLAQAKVYVSVLGSEKEEKDSMVGLINSASYIRKHLSKVMRMRTVPKLVFVLDKGLEHSNHIHELLRNIDLGEDSSDTSSNSADSETPDPS